MIRTSTAVFLVALLGIGGLTGCATGPGVDSATFQASALRVATSAYILRGETDADRVQRANRLVVHVVQLEVLAVELAESGRLSDETLAAAARGLIDAAGLSDRDRLLAEAIITEAIILFGAQTPGLDEAQQARIDPFLELLAQIKRVARMHAQ
jgi:hypothetical protein